MARSRQRRFFAALAPLLVGAPLALACNAIVGLSDFERGECPGARCGDGDGDVPDTGTDAELDAGADAPRGADPVSWARWEMPNYVLDGSTLPRAPEYTVSGNTATAKFTTLVWRTAPLPGDLTFEAARAACEELADGGPWRLPKRIELVSLLDYGRPKPHLDTDVFDVANVRVWTSSEVRPFVGGPSQQYWHVDFDTGAVETQAASLVAKALCVRAR